jgi:hypothetical protein
MGPRNVLEKMIKVASVTAATLITTAKVRGTGCSGIDNCLTPTATSAETEPTAAAGQETDASILQFPPDSLSIAEVSKMQRAM